MEEIIALLNSESPADAIPVLTAGGKDNEEIESYREEYHENKRDKRETQIGKTQVDKSVGSGQLKKRVPAVRIPIPFQQKISTTATAFEIGEPITLKASTKNKLVDEITRLWRSNRVDSLLQKLILLKKTETQSALLFYIKDIKPQNWLNKMFGVNEKKDIKCKILESKNGKMTPTFDAFGDMKYFTWEFTVIGQNKKEEKNVFVYDEEFLYHFKQVDGDFILEPKKPHGFKKIPIVYFEQEAPEWKPVQEMIDRIETTLSKLSASNDYSGHPILLLYGDVSGAPDKDEDGKAFRIDMKKDEDGKWVHGDVKFATYDQAPESIKLELEYLEKYIYSLSSTPDISFDSLSGIGAISGIAIRLMFLDAVIKAKMNEGENRTSIERIINLFMAGTITTTATKLSSESRETYFTVQFNSIIPNDLKETVETLSRAVESGILSVKAAVQSLDMTEDLEDELEELLKDRDNKAEKTPADPPTAE